jgi:hypothetical protein
MSVVKNDRCVCSFCNSSESGVGCSSQNGGIEEQNMAKYLTRQPFDVPSQAVLQLNESSDRVAWLSAARHLYKTKRSELEHQFESKAAELHEEYLAIILQIHESLEQ